jgi:hypothetical protein
LELSDFNLSREEVGCIGVSRQLEDFSHDLRPIRRPGNL